VHVPSLDSSKLAQAFRTAVAAFFLRQHQQLARAQARLVALRLQRGPLRQDRRHLRQTRLSLAQCIVRPPVSLQKMLVEEGSSSVLYRSEQYRKMNARPLPAVAPAFEKRDRTFNSAFRRSTRPRAVPPWPDPAGSHPPGSPPPGAAGAMHRRVHSDLDGRQEGRGEASRHFQPRRHPRAGRVLPDRGLQRNQDSGIRASGAAEGGPFCAGSTSSFPGSVMPSRAAARTIDNRSCISTPRRSTPAVSSG
jgi:hypothetical protein